MIHISADMDEWFDALDAIAGPGSETVSELSAAMEAGFRESQSLVHVMTGSLKASGRTHFEEPPDEWIGEISYGGPSPGSVHDPVTYASEELRRGGHHDDFFQSFDTLEHYLEEAMFATVRLRGVGT